MFHFQKSLSVRQKYIFLPVIQILAITRHTSYFQQEVIIFKQLCLYATRALVFIQIFEIFGNFLFFIIVS